MNISTSIKVLALIASMLPGNAFAEDDKDTTVVVPASGHVAFKPSRNFTGPADVICSNISASSSTKSTGLSFGNVKLDTAIIAHSATSSSGYVLTAKPGTYTLTLTDRTATKQFFTVSTRWADEAGTVDFKNYRIFKFVNSPDRTGFEVDATYAAEGYRHCDMGTDEHLYMALNDAATSPLARIADTMQTTIAEVTFIPWSKEMWGCPEVSDITGISSLSMVQPTDKQCFDLQGRRISGRPTKGLYIINGKKHIIR